MGEPENTYTPEDSGKKGQDVSAATVARMMGLATASDVKLLDGKIELLISRVASLTAKVEKTAQSVSKVSTTSDIDRIDLQISGLKSIVKDLFLAISSKSGDGDKDSVAQAVEDLDDK